MSKTRKKLGIQQLEEKAMMAGDVSVDFSAGLLSIEQNVGGNTDEQVMVSYIGNNTVRVFGLNGTSINGQSPNYNDFSQSCYQDFNVAGLQDVHVDLKGGNDSFSFDGGARGLDLQSMDINVGAEGGRGQFANDNDSVYLYNLDLSEGLNITTKDGTDIVDLSFVDVGTVGQDHDLEINTGRGADTVSLWYTNAEDDLKINTTRNTWDNDVDKVYLRYGQTIQDVDIDTGGGDDLVDLYRIRVGDDLYVDTYGGNDDVLIYDSDIGLYGYGVMDIDMGSGNADYAKIRYSTADSASLNGGIGSADKLYAYGNSFGNTNVNGFEASNI